MINSCSTSRRYPFLNPVGHFVISPNGLASLCGNPDPDLVSVCEALRPPLLRKLRQRLSPASDCYSGEKISCLSLRFFSRTTETSGTAKPATHPVLQITANLRISTTAHTQSLHPSHHHHSFININTNHHSP